MPQTEVIVILVCFLVVFTAFIVGLLLFMVQAKKNRTTFIQEKITIQHQHQQEILRTELEMQTQTMQEIGREIHDNVGQKLTLASLYTQQLDYDNQYPEITERVNSISNIINESLNELRSLSKNLTNDHIKEKPLKELIEIEIEKIKLAHHYQLDIIMDSVNGYSVLTKTILVRVVQEFFQNTMKYANASLISLHLQRKEDGLHLLLNDNGKGFHYTENEKYKGIGLQNMKKRVALVGGAISIVSVIEKGTSLSLFIPNEKL